MGVKAGEKVVFMGQQNLSEGAKVSVCSMPRLQSYNRGWEFGERQAKK